MRRLAIALVVMAVVGACTQTATGNVTDMASRTGTPAPPREVLEACGKVIKVANLLPSYVALRSFLSAFGTVRSAVPDLDEASAVTLAMTRLSTLQAISSDLPLSHTETRRCWRALQRAGIFG